MNLYLELSDIEVALVKNLLDNAETKNPGCGAGQALQKLEAAEAEASHEEPSHYPGEDMDGDFDSGMASAGFGTDEDYRAGEDM